jgi:hypothetical protein
MNSDTFIIFASALALAGILAGILIDRPRKSRAEKKGQKW